MEILFLGKKIIKENYYFEIFFCGAIKLVKVSKEYFDKCTLEVGESLDIQVFDISCYNKGFDTILNLKLK